MFCLTLWTLSLCLQSTAVDLASGMAELDSDMADITQSVPMESILGAEDGELPLDDTGLSKLGGEVLADHELTGSSHIPSSLGINPHTLQVEPPSRRRTLSDLKVLL